MTEREPDEVMWQQGRAAARALASRLEVLGSARVVFAESCTCGMTAALLGAVPGISNYLCGSAVTYRVATKTAWLNLDPQQIQRQSAESIATSRQMARSVLHATPEANWSAAITGDLGPTVPSRDGRVYLVIAHQSDRGPLTSHPKSATVAPSPAGATQIVFSRERELKSTARVKRQLEAATWVLHQLTVAIA